MAPKQVILYATEGGKEPYAEWIESLRDKAASLRIRNRIDRIAAEGHFGDHKSIGAGLFELRFHFGPGYRVYFGQSGDTVVILLCAGDKDTQQRDVALARSYWADWQASQEG